ncbi:hypothetical protein ACEN2J_08615 [Pseudorhodobacter sp. W20_MBD10_FR17]|uniref:hypothetical protein n=1 Tax=Pseudorhodobacter sp. W20_MBD10_FR17 TaxID=3240266 RepID=UPI003F9CD63E
MVIGVLLSGIVFGVFATLASLLMGAPLWAAILLYPVVGVFGAAAFITMAVLRSRVQSYGLSAAWQ